MPPKSATTGGRRAAPARAIPRRAPSAKAAAEPVAVPAAAPSSVDDAQTLRRLVEAMVNIDSGYGGELSVEERATQILGLRYPNGRALISLPARSVLVDIGGLFHEIGFDATMTYLQDSLRRNVPLKNLFLSAPTMQSARDYANRRVMNRTREAQTTKGVYRCGKCRSSNTTSIQKQTRGADEGFTDEVVCNDCGNKFRVG